MELKPGSTNQYFVKFPNDTQTYWFEASNLRKWVLPGASGGGTTPAKRKREEEPKKAKADKVKSEKPKADKAKTPSASKPAAPKSAAAAAAKTPAKTPTGLMALPPKPKPSTLPVAAKRAKLVEELKEIGERLGLQDLKALVTHAKDISQRYF